MAKDIQTSTKPFGGRLANYYMLPNGCYWGVLIHDELGRFPDMSPIRTSKTVKVSATEIETLNTRYELV